MGIVALAAIVVLGVLLAVTAPASPVLDVPAPSEAVANPPGTESTVTPPVPDFYDIDAGDLPDAAPGTMIKTEELTGAPSGTKVFRIMYHSRDDHGRDVPVSGLFASPDTAPPAGGFPLVAYAHGTTGLNPHCGISITPFEPNTPSYANWTTQLRQFVEGGWAVVATDYLGSGAPGTPTYLVGRVEAQGVLDSVRAAHGWNDRVDAGRTIIWGHSQGGHSAAFAAQLADEYAPELAIQGAAILAPGLLPSLPVAVNGLLKDPEPSGMTGFVMLIARSWTATYPDLLKPADVLTPRGVDKLPLVDSACGLLESEDFMDAPIGAYVKRPPAEEFFSAASVNTPGDTPIGMPIVMVQGLKDTTVIPQLTLGFHKLLCAHGDAVQFQTYPHDDHAGVVVSSRPLIMSWMSDRYDGKPAPDNCPNT